MWLLSINEKVSHTQKYQRSHYNFTKKGVTLSDHLDVEDRGETPTQDPQTMYITSYTRCQ